jgi:hypothetical protein
MSICCIWAYHWAKRFQPSQPGGSGGGVDSFWHPVLLLLLPLQVCWHVYYYYISSRIYYFIKNCSPLSQAQAQPRRHEKSFSVLWFQGPGRVIAADVCQLESG